MLDYPNLHVPYDEVIPMGHPFQIRVSGYTMHFNDYPTALEVFHFEAELEDPDEGSRPYVELFQLGEYAPGKKDWHLVSLANVRGGQRPVWTNLFAGRTLSHLFFLRNTERRALAQLGWPAPPDAVSWKYAVEVPPLEQQVAEALAPGKEPVELPSEVQYEPPVPETAGVDLAAWAADPACRVDEETLRRRMAMGWDLDRAMATPMLGPAFGEKPEYEIINGKRRYLPNYRGIPG